jgi:hypothetical protein
LLYAHLQIAMNRVGLDVTFHSQFEDIHILIDFQYFHFLFELKDLKLPVKRNQELLYLKIKELTRDLSFLS